MTEPGHNNPPVIVELTPELATFLLESTEANIGLLLGALGGVRSREKAERFVELLENNKGVRDALQKGMKS